MAKMRRLSALLTLCSLGACVNMPSGPGVLVLPGSGKSFDEFRSDDLSCRQYASEQVKLSPSEASMATGAGTALLGSALGALMGLAIGGGAGAAIGATSGLAVGGLVGTGGGMASANIYQQRYDNGYTQCMYVKGHRVPLPGQIMDNYGTSGRRQSIGTPPPPPSGNPPPPSSP